MKKLSLIFLVFLTTFAVAQQRVNIEDVREINPDYIKFQERKANGEDVFKTEDGHYTGYMPPKYLPDFTSYLKNYEKTTRTFPAKLDWRTGEGTGQAGVITPPKDQGQFGTCWAFAACGTIEAQLKLMGYGEYDLSELQMSTCDIQTIQGIGSGDPNGGNAERTVSFFIQNNKNGLGSESDAPYSWIGTNQNYSNTRDYSCRGFQNSGVADWQVRGLVILPRNKEVIKAKLQDDGPMQISCYGHGFQGNSVCDYQGGKTDHAVGLVGWDDNYSTQCGNGAWIVKNSWGPSQNDGGYFYIGYDDANWKDAKQYMDIVPADPNLTVHSYSKNGHEISTSWGETTYGKTVYLVAAGDKVTSVGFWTLDAGQDVTVELYAESSLSTLLATVPETTYEFPGYYTINLDNVIPAENSNHEVWIKVKYSGASGWMPLETLNPTGNSYESHDGISWDIRYDADICVNLYATSGEVSEPVVVTPPAPPTNTPVTTVLIDEKFGNGFSDWSTLDLDGDNEWINFKNAMFLKSHEQVQNDALYQYVNVPEGATVNFSVKARSTSTLKFETFKIIVYQNEDLHTETYEDIPNSWETYEKTYNDLSGEVAFIVTGISDDKWYLGVDNIYVEAVTNEVKNVDIFASLGFDNFVEGTTGAQNYFRAMAIPDGTAQANFTLEDGSGATLATGTSDGTDDVWAALLSMDGVNTGSKVTVDFEDGDGTAIGTPIEQNLSVIEKPEWMQLTGASMNVSGHAGSSIVIDAVFPFAQSNSATVGAISNMDGTVLNLDNGDISFEIIYNLMTGRTQVSNMMVNTDYTYGSEIGSTDIHMNGQIDFDMGFNLIAKMEGSTLFPGISNKLTVNYANDDVVVRPSTSTIETLLNTEIIASLSTDTLAGDWFMSDGTADEFDFISGCTLEGFTTMLSAPEVKLDGGIATGQTLLDVNQGYIIGFEQDDAQVTNIYFAASLIEGSVDVKTVQLAGSPLSFGPWTFNDESEGTAKENSMLVQEFDNKFAVSKERNNKNNVSEYVQPYINSENGQTATVWVEFDENNPGDGTLMFAAYDDDTNEFGDPVTITANNLSISNPQVASLSNGSAIVTWSQNTSSKTGNRNLKEIMQDQNLYVSYYNQADGTFSTPVMMTDGIVVGESVVAVDGEEYDNDKTLAIVAFVKQISETETEIWSKELSADVDGSLNTSQALKQVPNTTGVNSNLVIGYYTAFEVSLTWLHDADANIETFNNHAQYSLFYNSVWENTTDYFNASGNSTSRYDNIDEVDIFTGSTIYTGIALTQTVIDGDEKSNNFRILYDVVTLKSDDYKLDISKFEYDENNPFIIKFDEAYLERAATIREARRNNSKAFQDVYFDEEGYSYREPQVNIDVDNAVLTVMYKKRNDKLNSGGGAIDEVKIMSINMITKAEQDNSVSEFLGDDEARTWDVEASLTANGKIVTLSQETPSGTAITMSGLLTRGKVTNGIPFAPKVALRALELDGVGVAATTTPNATKMAPEADNPMNGVNVNEDNNGLLFVLYDHFFDYEAYGITFDVASDNESLVTVSELDNTLALIFEPNMNGDAEVTVTAINDHGSDSQTFNVTVNPVNDAPDAFSMTAPADAITITITAENIATGELELTWDASDDIEGDDVTYMPAFIDGLEDIVLQKTTETSVVLTYQEIVDALVTTGTHTGSWGVAATDGMDLTNATEGAFGLTIILDHEVGDIDNKLENNEISIYPNPVSNELFIEISDNSKAKCIIMDILGNELRNEAINSSEKMDISKLPSGIYFVKVITDTNEITKKIIKK